MTKRTMAAIVAAAVLVVGVAVSASERGSGRLIEDALRGLSAKDRAVLEEAGGIAKVRLKHPTRDLIVECLITGEEWTHLHPGAKIVIRDSFATDGEKTIVVYLRRLVFFEDERRNPHAGCRFLRFQPEVQICGGGVGISYWETTLEDPLGVD